MAEINPFRGIRYNQEIIKDLAAVICPPYDIISPEEQKAYYQKSDYNVVRLEHGMELPEDAEGNNKNSRANDTLKQWLKGGILQTDTVPAFYIHEHVFSYRDIRKKRLGLIACVKLEPWESKVVFPHESTSSGVKSDRLELMRACATNFSPLLGLYEDPGLKVTQLLITRAKLRPIIDFTGDGETHRIWMASEPEFVQRVSHFLAPKPIYIADGHHRYETALAYQQERQHALLSHTGREAFNFVMMTLVPFSDAGLMALPLHRLARNIPPQTLAGFRNQLENFFEVDSLPLDKTGVPASGAATMRVLGLEPKSVSVLKLHHSAPLKEIMPKGHSGVYTKLDVSLVQHLIIEKLITSSDKGDDIAYTPDIDQARQLVESGQYQLAFLLNPTPMATIKAIADAGDRMPRKSTYFYPKLPTGLVISRLGGEI